MKVTNPPTIISTSTRGMTYSMVVGYPLSVRDQTARSRPRFKRPPRGDAPRSDITTTTKERNPWRAS
jgi:hypothetical protein